MGDSPGEFLFSPNGRVSRTVFWVHQLLASGVVIILGFVIELLENANIDFTGARSFIVDLLLAWTLVSAIVLAGLGLWSFIAIKVKRWHDRNKSGHWIWLEFVPLIGPIWALIECGFLPGTDGQNRFGSPPYM